MTDDRIYIARVAKELRRAEHTVHQWVSQNVLPDELIPQREGGRKTMWWTPIQLEGLRSFAAERESRWRGGSRRV